MDQVPLQTYVEEVNGIPVLNAVGEIDLSTASIFKRAIHELIENGHRHILIDMSQVVFMDSSGFGTLLSAIKILRPQNGTVTLAGCNDAVSRMLGITRLDTLFNVHADRISAVHDIHARQATGQPV
jgi:anti-sigma B factor antagonist